MKGDKKDLNFAFPRRTLFMTKGGLRDVSDIETGDYILNHKNSFSKVLSKSEERGFLVELKGHGHPELRLLGSQGVWATHYDKQWNKDREVSERKFRRRRWVPAMDMKGMFWSSPIKFLSKDAPIKITNELAWLIGFYLSSGFIMYDKTINLRTNDFKFEKVEEVLRRLGLNYRVKHGSFVEFFIRDKEVSAFLEANFEYKYRLKNMPFWVYGMKECFRENLFEGFLWDNGIFEDSRCRVSARNKYLAIGMKLIAQTLGYSVALYVSKSRKKKRYTERWQIVAEVNARSSAIVSGSRLGLVREVKINKRKNIVYSLGLEGSDGYLIDGIFVK